MDKNVKALFRLGVRQHRPGCLLEALRLSWVLHEVTSLERAGIYIKPSEWDHSTGKSTGPVVARTS